MRKMVYLLMLLPACVCLPHIGVSVSSYQIEGAAYESCKEPSIWDTFTHQPWKIKDNTNGDIACDFYHHFREDIALLHSLHISHFRFSFSWTRLLSASGEVCDDGVRFYSEMLDELDRYNITPYATIFHWDLPQHIESYGGWLSRRVIEDFRHYSEFVFRTFGSRVKYWMTLNEPYTYCVNGYSTGVFAPGVIEPTRAPYVCGHHMLLAHAVVANMYRSEYAADTGRIGMALNSDWAIPARKNDVQAAERAMLFRLAWFSDPLLFGDYPDCMRIRLGERLPLFSDEERALLYESIDFFSLNHYTSFLTLDKSNQIYDFEHDPEVEYRNVVYRARGDSFWLYNVPEGIEKIIQWLGARYDRFFLSQQKPLVISENGVSMHNPYSVVDDDFRIEYLSGYLTHAIRGAETSGVNLSHYFIWSFLDNFEWSSGYTEKFGIVWVNMTDPARRRIPKKSAFWVQDLLKSP